METSNQVLFNPGDYVVRDKTAGDALYIIQEGQLAVYKMGVHGERIPLGMISSGQYVGEMAVLLDVPHRSNVVALTPVKAIRIAKTSIEAQLKGVPSWLLTLTKGLIERLQNANELLRRNGWVDESLMSQLKAIEDKFKGQK